MKPTSSCLDSCNIWKHSRLPSFFSRPENNLNLLHHPFLTTCVMVSQVTAPQCRDPRASLDGPSLWLPWTMHISAVADQLREEALTEMLKAFLI